MINSQIIIFLYRKECQKYLTYVFVLHLPILFGSNNVTFNSSTWQVSSLVPEHLTLSLIGLTVIRGSALEVSCLVCMKVEPAPKVILQPYIPREKDKKVVKKWLDNTCHTKSFDGAKNFQGLVVVLTIHHN